MLPVNTITTSYAINRLGYIFHPEDMTYLCGIKLTHNKKGLFSSACWTTDKDKAINVFNLCTVWESIADVCHQQSPVGTQMLIGYSSDIETYIPYELHAVNGKSLCLTSKGLSRTGWDTITPEQLYEWAAPAKPVLKSQSVSAWVFKMGTYYEPGTPAPNWDDLISNSYKPASFLKNRSQEELSNYFLLGTYCKPGTPHELVADCVHTLHGGSLVCFNKGEVTLSTKPKVGLTNLCMPAL